jgi:hypothetical protein
MTSQNQTPSQKAQKAREWWQSMSSEQKKQLQGKFQNKDAPTSDELVKAYEEQGDTTS